jgi:hypothetical protein
VNQLIDEINRLTREPVYVTIKYLYPKLYRIDDILTETPEIVQRLNYDKDTVIVCGLT